MKSHASFVESKRLLVLMTVIVSALFSQAIFGQQIKESSSDLLKQYIQSKGSGIISFDYSNIKQFWVDQSVVSKDKDIDIFLGMNKNNSFESVSFPIQLANVDESQDCTIEVLTDMSDVNFSVLNNNNTVIAESSAAEDFIQTRVLKGTFHLENTANLSFKMKFTSKSSRTIAIKAIILSFSKNTNSLFLTSPGTLRLSLDDLTFQAEGTYTATPDKDGAFTVKALYESMICKYNFFSRETSVSYSVSCENIGDLNLAVYTTFYFYSKDHKRLREDNYPYNGINNILKVVSAEKGSKTIVVDRYTEWEKNCFIALNAKEDLSDVPNFNILDAKIVEIVKKDDDSAVITLDKELAASLKKDTEIRVHGLRKHAGGATWNLLRPSEKKEYTLSIVKGKGCYTCSLEKIPEGVFYIKPVVISASTGEAHTLKISSFSIQY